MAASVGSKTELLNVLGDVKARIQDKLGICDFPMPQFILIGKQSVGKSRLIEALAGEVFTFVSGTLGSRRPTVLEFRNVACEGSRWFVRDLNTQQWGQQSVQDVMKLVGAAHEMLGATVTDEPVNVRIESPNCVDVTIVDLPGFRDFALDDEKKALAAQIEQLVLHFMRDPRNVMLCVEQAGDFANYSTLARCREVDPKSQRTILIRNKLDKFYKDITPENVNQWVDGYGEMPQGMVRFSMTLPFWQDGTTPPEPFVTMRDNKNKNDVDTMRQLNISASAAKTIGFQHFANFMEQKIQDLFVKSIGPVMDELNKLKKINSTNAESLVQEFDKTDPSKVVATTQKCGASFARALNEVMEGKQITFDHWSKTIEEELRDFHAYHKRSGSQCAMLPSEEFCGLEEYIEYLTMEMNIGTYPAKEDGKCELMPAHGGAQWRRLMQEIEIFLRFSEIAVQTKKRDVIQARGVSMTSLTWRDVVVKLLSNEAHLPLQQRVKYVAERITWFFQNQKECVTEFMIMSEGHSGGRANYAEEGRFIRQNAMIKSLVYQTYDQACYRQMESFIELFENMLTSTFSNPWVFLKGATAGSAIEGSTATASTLDRIPIEINSRAGVDTLLNRWLQDIPTDAADIDEAVDKVQQLVLKTYSYIRAQVCDQVELFAESFFKTPMLNRLTEDMHHIGLTSEDKERVSLERGRLEEEKNYATESLKEINWCIDRLQQFRVRTEAQNPQH